ncbi:MAG: hypothetical protein EP343_02740 [Deltaproteobacteria bacterium]|nr:MAG: hypothetical protein EP343_02740 [Deltaproteobacteria bacterium]
MTPPTISSSPTLFRTQVGFHLLLVVLGMFLFLAPSLSQADPTQKCRKVVDKIAIHLTLASKQALKKEELNKFSDALTVYYRMNCPTYVQFWWDRTKATGKNKKRWDRIVRDLNTPCKTYDLKACVKGGFILDSMTGGKHAMWGMNISKMKLQVGFTPVGKMVAKRRGKVWAPGYKRTLFKKTRSPLGVYWYHCAFQKWAGGVRLPALLRQRVLCWVGLDGSVYVQSFHAGKKMVDPLRQRQLCTMTLKHKVYKAGVKRFCGPMPR